MKKSIATLLFSFLCLAIQAQFFIEYNTGVDISLNGLKENEEFPFEHTNVERMEPFYQYLYDEDSNGNDYYYYAQTGSGIINKFSHCWCCHQQITPIYWYSFQQIYIISLLVTTPTVG